MTQAQIGVTGLAVMGANLARNLARHGHAVAVHNRSQYRTKALIEEHGDEGTFVPCDTPEELVAALERPRRILIMVKAGAPTDAVIEEFAPLLEPGDMLVDGGNAHFADTRRREADLRARGLHFVGAGVSGGEEGALLGPSIMPGGSKESYQALGPLLEDIAAKVDGVPCCTHIGPDGAGHYVKMVPQRHRVRRHAAHRRGLRPAQAGARPDPGGAGGHLRRVERGRAVLVPDRDHRGGAPPGRRGHRYAAGRRDRRPGRAEGHRPLDGADRA
ncbi:hypothetical protein GCM10017559_77280 [Streptosporangium longisporum]|uniref:6-phosphogluconate dehydrogenase NADP-binding domain-containing protein n=1 Tax=Streptosporangium longisporum TaxID=46187 RepID=A0ABP6LAV4_9ACTN